jgi:hypothetical protein
MRKEREIEKEKNILYQFIILQSFRMSDIQLLCFTKQNVYLVALGNTLNIHKNIPSKTAKIVM